MSRIVCTAQAGVETALRLRAHLRLPVMLLMSDLLTLATETNFDAAVFSFVVGGAPAHAGSVSMVSAHSPKYEVIQFTILFAI